MALSVAEIDERRAFLEERIAEVGVVVDADVVVAVRRSSPLFSTPPPSLPLRLGHCEDQTPERRTAIESERLEPPGSGEKASEQRRR